MSDAHVPPRPRGLRVLLIVFTLLWLLLIVPVCLMAVTSPMLTDAGVNAGVWALMAGGALGPIVFLASLIAAWVGFGTRRYRLAKVAMCGPLAWLVYLIAAFQLIKLTPLHGV